MKNPPNGGVLCYIKVGGRKLEVTVIKLTHAWDRPMVKAVAYGMSRSMLFASLNLSFLRLLFIPRTDTESVLHSFL